MTELINRYELDSDVETNDSETDVESNTETNDTETNNSEKNNMETDENIYRLNPEITSDQEIRQNSSESPDSPEFYMFENDGFLQTRDDVIHTAFISAIAICGILTIWASTVNNLTLAIVSLVIMTVIMLGGLIKFIITKFKS